MQTVTNHRFRSLDAFRGLAALVVVVHHVMLSLPDGVRHQFAPIESALGMGARCAVMLFFVLSGFVLSLPYFTGKNLSYGPYLVRRLSRLYPPFAFAVLISAFLCWWLGGPSIPIASSWLNLPWSAPPTASVVASHLLMEGIGLRQSIRLDGPIWSLIIEMRVSLIFPLLVLYVRKFGWAGVAVALATAFLCAKAQTALGENTAGLVGESLAGAILLTGRYVVMFLLGVILAARLERIKATFLRIPVAVHSIIFGGMACIWVALIYTKALEPHRGFVDVFSGVCTLYLIVACLVFPRVSALVSGRVCLWLGDISYSFYLIHLPVLMAMFYLLYGRLSLMWIIALSFPAMLIAGHLMYSWVERPSMFVGKTLARRWSTVPTKPADLPYGNVSEDSGQTQTPRS
jgi:peptidoglycan/LPS O-acetylase OafA/YrhL